ncbi:MAG: nitrate reductase cytochrome c-type subunit [Nitrospirae bacterium]|nr:nitrate reductase cytochrome c-type subunit [Nitrospirota bacterium]
MSRKIYIVLTVALTAIVLLWAALVYAQTGKAFTEEELGLRKETLYDESKELPARGAPITKEPGTGKKFERSFENSPPLISHDITGMLPIARTDNMCMGCHMPDAVSATGATAIPQSHFFDLDTGKDLAGNLDGKRYNCMQCHAIQTTITPPVKNLFKSEFRSKKGKYRSNLLDTLNEGVKAE